MAIFRCKSCGGDLIIEPGMSVCECEYCGSKQTVPSADNEKKMNLFARAGRLLRACEFDKAAGIFEAIAADFPEEAEAYWGMVLCRYGIEYVDDPATGKKVPTCHRSGFESVMEDSDFEQACENADAVARRQYREEAKVIEELRKSIIEISGKEEPYDIFICYKETDPEGDRTMDSVLAQDVYDALTEKGYRVFFSRITLEDKLGQEYEPYIFAALHSAKVMLAFGTDYEYYEAVWVKNEWSRYLKLMEQDKTRHLIPCYKNIDAYDMPKEFAKLQAQDMGKVGAVQDLLRGIEKLIGKSKTAHAEEPSQPKGQQVAIGGPNKEALYKRGQMALEDGAWEKAKEYYDQVLNIDAECAEAYLGLALAEAEFRGLDALESDEALQKGKLKCRICGAELKIFPGESAVTCECCGFVQTIATIQSVQLNRFANSSAYAKFLRFASNDRKQKVSELLEKGKKAKQEADEAYQKKKALDEARKEEATARKAKETRKKILNHIEEIKPFQNLVSSGYSHVVALRADGTVLACGDNQHGECNVSSWRNMVAVAAGFQFTVGLQGNGTVLAVGNKRDGCCDANRWKNIAEIAVTPDQVLGLRRDGTAISVGRRSESVCNVSAWKNVVSIMATTVGGASALFGLQSDGRVLVAGLDQSGQTEIAKWTCITSISAGFAHVVGLRADGSVVAAGSNRKGQCNVSGWRHIVMISACVNCTVGLKDDGTVVFAGDDDWRSYYSRHQRPTCGGWKEVVEVASCTGASLGLTANGNLLIEAEEEDDIRKAIKKNNIFCFCKNPEPTALQRDGKILMISNYEEIKTWKLFNSVDTFEIEQQEAKAKWLEDLRGEKESLSEELGNLKGLFTGRRRKEIENRLEEIEADISIEEAKVKSREVLESIQTEDNDIYQKESLYGAKIRDIVEFGNYQGNIRWKVLAAQDNRLLLITESAIENRPYDISGADVTWETCFLREWLNETFLNKAFSKKEQAMILETKVTADKNPEYSTNPGENTQDRIFLLSIQEANQYFSSDRDRKCCVEGDDSACWWWLRSPGDDSDCAATVSPGGSIDNNGYAFDDADFAVRPALWINLES